jgi:hypothetical protein
MPHYCLHDAGIYCQYCNPYGPRTTYYQIPYVSIPFVQTPPTTTVPPSVTITTTSDKPAPVASSDLTEAEKFFDSVVKERRAKGRQTYGKGLDHKDEYDWNRMAMEEAMDLAQYLAAENTRLRDRIAQQTKAIVELTAALEKAK